MMCSKPVFLKNVGLEVPCGRCINCRVSRSREWSVRLMCELQTNPNALFLTFTYDDDHLPSDFGLHKAYMQGFHKRLRERLRSEQNRKIRFFACGEYGEQFGRPHYHGIYFGLSFSDLDLIRAVWGNGFVYAGLVEYDSCRYVTDYVLKKWSGKKAEDEYHGREPPFQLFSRGLGKDWLFANSTKLIDTLSVRQQGTDKGLPRYFKNKLVEIQEEVALKLLCEGDSRDVEEILNSCSTVKKRCVDIAKNNHQKELKEWISQVECGNFHGDYDEWKNLRQRQRGLSAEQRTVIYRKGDL